MKLVCSVCGKEGRPAHREGNPCNSIRGYKDEHMPFERNYFCEGRMIKEPTSQMNTINLTETECLILCFANGDLIIHVEDFANEAFNEKFEVGSADSLFKIIGEPDEQFKDYHYGLTEKGEEALKTIKIKVFGPYFGPLF